MADISTGETVLRYADGQPVPPYLSPADVARLFDISIGCVYTAIKKKELKCKAFSSRQFRIQREDALEWFSS